MIKKNIFSAILLAAGDSSRIGGAVCKPFLTIAGKPLIAYCLEAFEKCDDIQEIVVVAKEQHEKTVNQICQEFGITKFKKFTKGGKTRQQSAFAGVKSAKKTATHFCLHDTARALILPHVISEATKYAALFGAASVAVAAKDTVKLKDGNNLVIRTLPRQNLVLVQTPQAFEKELYLKAMNKAIAEHRDYTDDCQLIEALSEKVYLCKGDYRNIKITTKEDLISAEALLHSII